jgi:phosphate transport system permease protein
MTYRKFKNYIFISMVFVMAMLGLVPLFHVFYYVLGHGLSVINLDFFTQLPMPVGEAGGGIGHAILGSLILICMTSLISIPLGLGMGVLLSEYKHKKISKILGSVIELLSSIPSIVIGLFAYTVFVKPFKGFSVHSGAIALSLVMIPLIARSSEEMLRLVPQSTREAGLALGLPRYKMIIEIVIKGSLRSLLVGVILSIARISGETAPLLFTAFASQQWFLGLSQPIASLPVQIYTYAISPYEDWNEKAWGGALVLMVLVVGLNLMIRMIFSRKQERS